jgi:hypothetical protein
MRGIFWNSRGLLDSAKSHFLAETASEQNLDFISLMETGRPNFTSQFLGNISGGMDFAWYCLPPHGRSGGILLGVNRNSLDVRKMEWGIMLLSFTCVPNLTVLIGPLLCSMGLRNTRTYLLSWLS